MLLAFIAVPYVIMLLVFVFVLAFIGVGGRSPIRNIKLFTLDMLL